MLPAVFLIAQTATLTFLNDLCSLLLTVPISYLYYIFHFTLLLTQKPLCRFLGFGLLSYVSSSAKVVDY